MKEFNFFIEDMELVDTQLVGGNSLEFEPEVMH